MRTETFTCDYCKAETEVSYPKGWSRITIEPWGNVRPSTYDACGECTKKLTPAEEPHA